jgi:hypothetical protein
MMERETPSVTLLPAQLARLTALTGLNGTRGAIGILAQEGSTLHIDTGRERFWMDAQGERIEHQEQERLAC